MKYGIIVNPISGKRNPDGKKRLLDLASEVLNRDCIIAGMDTTSREQLCQCAIELASKVSTLIIAGGDGTISDVVNAVDTDMVFAHLPIGSACAFAQSAKIPKNIINSAIAIRDGSVHKLDMTLCDNEKKLS